MCRRIALLVSVMGVVVKSNNVHKKFIIFYEIYNEMY